MLDGEAEAEISELFAMKDQEWALCTGGFTGVKMGHRPRSRGFGSQKGYRT